MKKRYPNKELIRRQAKLANKAIRDLAKIGVEIITVSFRNPRPLIEVAYCPGTDRIRNFSKGQGKDGNGVCYFRKVAHIGGCQVEWSEPRS